MALRQTRARAAKAPYLVGLRCGQGEMNLGRDSALLPTDEMLISYCPLTKEQKTL